MELEGSVLLRKDIKTKTVSLLKSFRDKKTGEIKPVLDKHGKKQSQLHTGIRGTRIYY